jgi:hypothetical protein
MVPFCVLQIRFVPTPTTIIWMIIAVTRFFTMSSVSSSYLDTWYSGERREEHLYQTMGIKRWKDAPTNCERRKDAQASDEKKMTYVTVFN